MLKKLIRGPSMGRRIRRYQLALVGLVVVCVVAVALTRSSTGAQELAAQALDETADTVRLEMRLYTEAADKMFEIVAVWAEEGLLDAAGPVSAHKVTASLLRTTPLATSLMFASDSGERYTISRVKDGFEVKWLVDGKRKRWRLNRVGDRVGDARDVDDFYSGWNEWMEEARNSLGETVRGGVHALGATGEPGRTVAVARKLETRSGERIGYFAMVTSLARMSEVTGAIRPTPNGQVVIVDERDNMVAWPAQYEPTGNRGRYENVSAAGSPALTEAVRLRKHSTGAPFKIEVAGKIWWTKSFLASHQDSKKPAWSVTMVPESDLEGLSKIKGFHVVIGALIVIAIAVVLAIGMTREFERRLAAAEKTRRLGRYTLEEKIGSGGHGTVYRARHAMLQRPTAVKVLSSENATRQGVSRFEQEVQMTSTLTHPNTVEVYDYGNTEEGTFYYAMEFIDGVTLAELVSVCGPVTPGRAVHFLVQMCGSMVEAHDIGLVHRDIKPANVMVCERGGLFDTIKVLDFGIAIAAGSDEDDVVGTPLYMAPESIQNLSGATTATDVYAIGAVAYFLITGRPVFDGDNVLQVCAQQLCDPPVPPSKQIDGVPPDFNDLILRCLAKKQEERPSAAELLSALEALDCGTEWSEVHAARWWRHHAQDLPPRYREVCGDKQVLTVDLDQHP